MKNLRIFEIVNSFALGVKSGSAAFYGLLCGRNGSFAVMTSILAVPIIVAAGMSVELANALQKKKDFQNGIDAATIAAAARGGTLDQTLSAKYFQPSSQTGGYVVTGPTFDKDADGTVTGTVQIDIPTNLLRIGGFNTLSVKVTSKAIGLTETKLSKATFQIISASGAYDKDFYFFTRDASGTILSETLILKYDYDGSKGTKTYTPAIATTNTITVGTYASYGYEMVVFEDPSYTGKRIRPKKYYSDAADASTFQKQTGTCSSASGQTNNWEDGGDGNYQDFVFKTTCVESSVLTGHARLTQ
jgi:Flp pilus assembly protein TadG